MVVFALPRAGGERSCRLGITATRKLGGAVVRTRCKRRLREVYRRHPETLDGVALDLVVNARRGCLDASWEDLRLDYIACVKRLCDRLAGNDALKS